MNITKKSLLEALEKDISAPLEKKERCKKIWETMPVLKGIETKDGFRVWCPYCRVIHTHGFGEGTRSPHCGTKSRWRDIFGEEQEYYVESFTNKELKAMGLEIKKGGRRK